jgi:hypothetical protein
LVAVAAASPETISPLMKNAPNTAVRKKSKYTTPVILALERGDTSGLFSVVTAVLMLVSPLTLSFGSHPEAAAL